MTKSVSTPAPAVGYYLAHAIQTFLVLSLILLCLISTPGLVFAKEHTSERQQLGLLTASLTQLHRQYQQADSEQKSLIEADLLEIAKQRHTLLLAIAHNEPETVLSFALPKQIKAAYPTSIKPLLEEWVSTEGKLVNLFVDHHVPEKSHVISYLEQNANRVDLAISGQAHEPKFMTGSSVIVQGLLLNQDAAQKPLIVLNSDQMMLAAGGTSDPTITSQQTTLENTIGEQRTAVIMVNFQDNPSDQPWTASYVSNRFFNGVSEFFLENSYQQTWLTGDVFGWYTIGVNSTDACNYGQIGDAANAAVQADNINLANYARVVYVFPVMSNCYWGGIATVGGTMEQTYAWINGSIDGHIPAHEMGHNFGLFHSHGLNCSDYTESNCTQITYGDTLDTMGGAPAHYNSFQKERLGWLNNHQSPPIDVISQSGSYAVEVYETQSTNTKALKVFRDVDVVSGKNRWFFIELRQAIGQDQIIASDPFLDSENITSGIIVHSGIDQNGDSSFLLDMTPESDLSYNLADLNDPALVSGSSFTDSVTGLTITNEYTDSQMASVYISYEGSSPTPAVCTRQNPSVAVTPVTSQWVSAGTSVDFTFNVTNNDSSACPSSVFALSAATPTGWTSNSPQVMLTAGETKSTTVTITSANNAIDNFYNINVLASNTDVNGYSSSKVVTYVVSNVSANSSPVASDDYAEMATISPIQINVMTNDFDPDGDAIYLATIGTPAKGDVSVNSNGSLTYTPAKRFKGTDSFSYTISDGMASAVATVYISLQSSSGTTDGGTSDSGSKGGKGGKPAR